MQTAAIEAERRTERGLAYDAFSSVMRKAAEKFTHVSKLSPERLAQECAADPDLKEMHDLNQKVLGLRGERERGLSPADVHFDQIMNNLSVQYANDEFVGLDIMPQVFTDGSRSGTFFKYAKADLLDPPDDTVTASRNQPNAIAQGRSTGTYALQNRSLKEELTWELIQNQTAPLNELMSAQEMVLYNLEMRREMRIAAVAMGASNYASTNKVTIAAADRWDSAGGGDPAAVFDTLKRALWRGPSPSKLKVLFTRPTFDILKRHPQVMATVVAGGNNARPAGVSRQALAEFLGVDEVIVASGRKIGDEYIWGSSGVWMGYVPLRPTVKSAGFGYTFQDGPTRSDLFWLPEESSGGLYRARCSFQDQANIVCADSAAIIITPNG